MYPITARRPTERRPVRAGALLLAAAVSAASLAGCAARSVPQAATSVAGQQILSSPGSVTIVPPPNNPDAPALHITGAVLVPGPQGNVELRMTVNNESAATEHLYAATTSDAATVGLFTTPPGAAATPQPADATGGITLNGDTTTEFGPGGPRILLEDPTGLARAKTVAITLVFAVAGIVHLVALVSAAAAVPAPSASVSPSISASASASTSASTSASASQSATATP